MSLMIVPQKYVSAAFGFDLPWKPGYIPAAFPSQPLVKPKDSGFVAGLSGRSRANSEIGHS